MSTPIADLSYRGYDGPLESPRFRWWVIARSHARRTFNKRLYWVCTGLSGWYFVVLMVILFFTEIAAQSAAQVGRRGGPSLDFIRGIVWKDQFVHGFNFGQLIFLVIALFVGVGAIANDNRANAMLIYLSKPCTKLDYLIGKLLGVFMPLFVAMLLPSTIFYFYGVLSYQRYGFSSDHWLYPKVVLGCAIGAAFHSAFSLALSSLFKQGRVAGAAYAGIYLVGSMFVTTVVVAWRFLSTNQRPSSQVLVPLTQNLANCSIDGVLVGMFKGVLGTDGGPPFGIPQTASILPTPHLLPILLAMTALMAAFVLIIWVRIRAVEVVN